MNPMTEKIYTMLTIAQLDTNAASDNAGATGTAVAADAASTTTEATTEVATDAAVATPAGAGSMDADSSTLPSLLPDADIAPAASVTDWSEPVDAVRGIVENLLAAGGPVVAILLLMSIVALAIILLKWWQFAMLRLTARSPVDKALRLWREGRSEAAIKALNRSRQPVAQLVRLTMVGLLRPGFDAALVREEVSRVASMQLERLRSLLRPLELIATLSPLLGLLGTVLGMIEAFRQLEVAGSQVDPAILSGGIWQALLTTAVGLVVAIPVVLAHAWLERKVERCGHLMEDAVTQVFTRNLQPLPARHEAAADPALNHAA